MDCGADMHTLTPTHTHTHFTVQYTVHCLRTAHTHKHTHWYKHWLDTETILLKEVANMQGRRWSWEMKCCAAELRTHRLVSVVWTTVQTERKKRTRISVHSVTYLKDGPEGFAASFRGFALDCPVLIETVQQPAHCITSLFFVLFCLVWRFVLKMPRFLVTTVTTRCESAQSYRKGVWRLVNRQELDSFITV